MADPTDPEVPGPPVVRDDAERNRFLIVVDGTEAELVYRRTDERLILVHTGVPDELSGRGLGGDLVRAAIDVAERDGLVVAPWCPFARRWLEDHPQVAGRVELDLEPPPKR